MAPTLTIQASLRGIDRHQAQTLGGRDFHGGPEPQVCRILTADRRDPMAVVPLRRPRVGLGAVPAVHGGWIKTLWPAFWHQDDALRDHAPCDPACALLCGSPRARRGSVNPSVEVGISLAASRLTGVLTFPALRQGTVTIRRCGARETR